MKTLRRHMADAVLSPHLIILMLSWSFVVLFAGWVGSTTGTLTFLFGTGCVWTEGPPC